MLGKFLKKADTHDEILKEIRSYMTEIHQKKNRVTCSHYQVIGIIIQPSVCNLEPMSKGYIS